MTIKELKEFIHISENASKPVEIHSAIKAKLLYRYYTYKEYIKDENIDNLKLDKQCYPIGINKDFIMIWVE